MTRRQWLGALGTGTGLVALMPWVVSWSERMEDDGRTLAVSLTASRGWRRVSNTYVIGAPPGRGLDADEILRARTVARRELSAWLVRQ